MTVPNRFGSLFFRQDLNSMGIPFLTANLILLLFPHPFSVLLFVLLTLALLAFSLKKQKETAKVLLLVSLGIALALVSYGIFAAREERAAHFNEQTLKVQGYITESGEESAVLSVYAVGERFHREKILLDGKNDFFQGAKVEGTLRLSCPTASEKNLGFSHVGKDLSSLKVVGKSGFLSFVASLRTSVACRLGSHRVGGFYKAILLGDLSSLTSEDKEAFRLADSSHLLAISGLHVTQIFGIFYFFLQYLPLGKKVRYALLLPILFFVLFITGGAVSVFRASVMASFPLVGKILSRRSDSVTALVFAACLLTFWDPAYLLTPSFLFSFVSAFSIVYASSHLTDALQNRLLSDEKGKYRLGKRILFFFLSMEIISVVLFVFHFPIQLLLFGKVRPLAPLFAMILIPLFSPCLVLGIARGVPMPFSFLESAVRTLSDAYGTFYLDLVRTLSFVSYEPIALQNASFPVAMAALAFLIGSMIVKARLRILFFMYAFLVLFSFLTPLFIL